MEFKLRRLWAVNAAVLAATAVAAPVAEGAWGLPFNLSAAGQDASEPHVAVDADGDAVFGWTRFDGSTTLAQVRTRTAAGTLSAVQNLSGEGGAASEAEVDVDDGGDAVFTWVRSAGANETVQARARTAGGALSAVQNLSAPGEGAFDAQVAVDDDGDAVFVWARVDGGNTRIQARARSAEGVLGPIETLSGAGATEPQVAVDSDGDAVFAWLRFNETLSTLQARALSNAGVLGPVQNVSGDNAEASEPEVAVDSDGDAVFAWSRLGVSDRIQARSRSSAGLLGAVQNLSDPGQSASEPEVALEAGGRAVFAWVGFDGASDRIQARTRSAAGNLSAIGNISTAGQSASEPQVEVDSGGDAVFAWLRLGPRNRIQARTRSASGVLGTVETLSSAGEDASEPDLAAGADGTAVGTWVRSDGANDRIQGAAGP